MMDAASSPGPVTSPDPGTGSPGLPAHRAPAAARRFGYLVAIAVNVALLVLVFVAPGWRAVPFLTEATTEVLPLLATSIALGILVNLVWLVADPPWSRALGDVVTTAVSLAVVVTTLQVFPFSYEDGTPWASVTRVFLWVAIVGSTFGVISHLVRFVRALAVRGPQPV